MTAGSIGRDSFVNDRSTLTAPRNAGADRLAQPSWKHRLRQCFVHGREERPDLANVEPGNHDDFAEKARAVAVERLHHFDAADFRQDDIEKDDVVLLVAEEAQSLLAIGGEIEGEVERFQQLSEKPAGSGIIFDDQGT